MASDPNRRSAAESLAAPAFRKVKRVAPESSPETPDREGAGPGSRPRAHPQGTLHLEEFMQLEWERDLDASLAARRSRVGHARKPGDYICTEIGRESVLLVRQARRRRARLLQRVPASRQPAAPDGPWQHRYLQVPVSPLGVRLDGAFKRIPDLETFPQGAPPCRGLVEVRCDTWGGFVWFSLNPHVEPAARFPRPDAAAPRSVQLPRRWR